MIWSDLERRLMSPRVQALLLTSLALGFVLFRWLQRLEPWNSDDLDLFQISADALAGKHWLLGAPLDAEARIPHPAFRIGLLPVTVPVIGLLGANATAFYLVPLAFALLGFGALYRVLFTQFGPLAALLFALIHVAWPFELQHSSLLLTDLPSAACSLCCFLLLEAASRRSGVRQVGYALLAGLAGVESQLLRNNSLALLAPAFLVFVLHRPTRRPALWAGALLGLGALGQQLLLVQRGLGWGADWRATRADFADYAQYQPLHSWSAFLLRQFVYQWSSFGRVAARAWALAGARPARAAARDRRVRAVHLAAVLVLDLRAGPGRSARDGATELSFPAALRLLQPGGLGLGLVRAAQQARSGLRASVRAGGAAAAARLLLVQRVLDVPVHLSRRPDAAAGAQPGTARRTT